MNKRFITETINQHVLASEARILEKCAAMIEAKVQRPTEFTVEVGESAQLELAPRTLKAAVLELLPEQRLPQDVTVLEADSSYFPGAIGRVIASRRWFPGYAEASLPSLALGVCSALYSEGRVERRAVEMSSPVKEGSKCRVQVINRPAWAYWRKSSQADLQ